MNEKLLDDIAEQLAKDLPLTEKPYVDIDDKTIGISIETQHDELFELIEVEPYLQDDMEAEVIAKQIEDDLSDAEHWLNTVADDVRDNGIEDFTVFARWIASINDFLSR